jgi:hypothetical protein
MCSLERIIDWEWQDLIEKNEHATEEEALGQLIAKHFDYNAVSILETAAWAMEKTGQYRDVCEQLWMLAGKVQYQRRHP